MYKAHKIKVRLISFKLFQSHISGELHPQTKIYSSFKVGKRINSDTVTCLERIIIKKIIYYSMPDCLYVVVFPGSTPLHN